MEEQVEEENLENFEESEEKPPEKRIFRGENYSDEEREKESKKAGPSKPMDELDMMELIQRRTKSREPTTVIVHRGDLIKAQTLGMSVSPSAIKPGEVKQQVKLHTTRLIRVLNRYREIDEREYQKFKRCMVDDKRVEKIYNNFYLLHKGYSSQVLIFVLNSYDETGICRLFQEFYLEFDQNNDKKMQIDELEKCIEFLGKDNYIGRKKMVETLKEYDINCSNSLSLFQEGNAGKILNDETLNKLFKKMAFDGISKKQGHNEEHVDFMKFAPMLSIFFFEYFATNYLKRKEMYHMYLGFPYIYKPGGKAEVNPEGDPEGLFRVFISQLKGENDVKKQIITFKDVSNALIIYRSSGFSDAISMEAIERILKQVKELMDVDPVSDKESRKFSMEELLPILVCKIATEMTWHKNLFRKSIEKYDKMVEWHGCALAVNLTKDIIHDLINDAFCYLPFPTFEQFVKGLDFVLKKLIPTLVSPASIFIAKKLMRTPDTIITEEGFNGEVRVRFNVKYITSSDNLFERLFYFSTKFQIKLMLVRMLYKNFYPNYKKEKEINSVILKYNQIMTTFDLFESGDPGKLGNFEDAFLNLLKSGDPEEIAKEESERREMKKKKFLETLLNQDNIAAEKRKNKLNTVKRKSSRGFTVDIVGHGTKRKKNEMKIKLDMLLAEANRIDTNINKREAEKLKEISRTRVTSAFPNSEDITPEIIMNLIDYSTNSSEDIEMLRKFIYYETEKIGFQDVQKFLIAQHIKKIEDREISKKKKLEGKAKEEKEKKLEKIKKNTKIENKELKDLKYHKKNITLESNIQVKEKKEEKESDKLMKIKTVYTHRDIFEEQRNAIDQLESDENTLISANSPREMSPTILKHAKTEKITSLKTFITHKSSQLNSHISPRTITLESLSDMKNNENLEHIESIERIESPEILRKFNEEEVESPLEETKNEEIFDENVFVGIENSDEFEEKYFKDFASRKRNEIAKIKEKNDKNEDKDRGCECVIT